jgi:hypothetical protein
MNTQCITHTRIHTYIHTQIIVNNSKYLHTYTGTHIQTNTHIQGVCHFYMVNNDPLNSSTYEKFIIKIQPYILQGQITLYHIEPDPKLKGWNMHIQIKYMTNVVLARVKSDHLVEWLLVVDLDEFMYAPPLNQTIASVLAGMTPDEDLICIPWNMYGTSGFLKQPPCIVPFFLKRTPHRGKFVSLPVKCAVRVSNATELGVHFHRTTNGQRDYVPKMPFLKSVYFATRGSIAFRLPKYNMREDNMHMWPLRINHYQMQSVEHYKRKRTKDSHRYLTDIEYWDRNDSVVDDTLARKMHWRSSNVPACGPEEW